MKPKDLLDFKISSLSEKNIHFDFEDIVRKFMKREICPNLIEETGPASGGDGSLSPTCTCIPAVSYIYACTDINASNYNSSANRDDGRCIVPSSNEPDENDSNEDLMMVMMIHLVQLLV